MRPSLPFIAMSEWNFQWLNYVTRTTGRLKKIVRFFSMEGAKLKYLGNNRTARKRDGKILGEMEDVYPQLLLAIFICNAPHWMHMVWSLARRIIPKRVVEKIDVLEPKTNPAELQKILRFIDIETLPVSLGGKNTVPPNEWPVIG